MVRSAAAEFELVKQARAAVQELGQQDRSQNTREQYARAWARLRDDPRPLDAIAGTKRTLYAYRAAISWGLGQELGELLKQRDRAQRSGDHAQRAALVNQIEGHLQRLEATRGERWTGGRVRGPNAKRGDLGALPRDWRAQLLAGTGGSTYRDELAVLALSGCRPEELCKGVQVELTSNGLALTIEGAKVTTENGQPLRRLLIDPTTSAAAEHLAERAAGGPLVVGEGRTTGGLREAVRRLGRRVLGVDTVTPYLYRHALSADLKAAGIEPGQIAAALGHASDRSQQHYGMFGQGGGAVGLKAVEAARTVREHGQDAERLLNRTWERTEPEKGHQATQQRSERSYDGPSFDF